MVPVSVDGRAVAQDRVLGPEHRHRNVGVVGVVDDERLKILKIWLSSKMSVKLQNQESVCSEFHISSFTQ